MKVLWFSNVNLAITCKESGSWLFSMAESLKSYTNINLLNISQSAIISEIKDVKINDNLNQILLPCFPLIKGIPSHNNINKIKEIVNSYNPDIIHVWGTECYWGVLTSRGYIEGRILLEMQGILSTCYNAFYANLTPSKIFKCFSLKELIRPSRFIVFERYKLKSRIAREHEIIKGHKYISVQSQWVEQYVNLFYKNKTIYHSLISVRLPFLENKWIKKNTFANARLITLTSSVPYKGLLDLIYTLSIVKQTIPNVKLIIIGAFKTDIWDIRISGYERLILKTIKQKHLLENIEFLGSLDAETIVAELEKADVFIQSSYIESYSLALAEAMAFGIPCVTTFAGAMPELGSDGDSLSYYSPGDYFSCAAKILRLLESTSLSTKYSSASRSLGKERNDINLAAKRQLKIYEEILSIKKQ